VQIILAVMMIGSQTTEPATQPASAPVPLQRLQAEAQVAGLPRRQLNSIADLFRFEQRGSFLFVRCTIEDIDEHTRLIIPGDASIITLRPMGQRPLAGADENEPRDFNFLQQEFVGPTSLQVNTTVILGAGRLTLARETEDANATSSVQLLQDPPPPDAVPNPDEPPVRLYVSKLKSDGSPDLQVRHTAQSFRELCLQYPQDINQYVRPILRELKQESAVFAPDAKLAWQVLSEDWKPSQSLIEKVRALVGKLDAGDFKQRSAAMEELKGLGQPAAIVLLKTDRSKLSAEQQGAVDSLLESYVLVSNDQAAKLREDLDFLIDTLSSDDPQLRQLAWQRLEKLTNVQVQFDPAADPAARADAIERLRASLKK